MKSNKHFTNIYLQKKYFGSIFLIPPTPYIEFIKKVFENYKNADIPKTLKELKRLALEEAKKIKGSKVKRDHEGLIILPKDIIAKILRAVYVVIDPILFKINQNYKNERRKYYTDNERYMQTIKNFEKQKKDLLNFTLKSICKYKKIRTSTLSNSILHYLKIKDEEIEQILNNFIKSGKGTILAPKRLEVCEIIEMLKFYVENLEYIVKNSLEIVKYSLVILNDVIYENYGFEEEQIFAFIEENKLMKNREICEQVNMIKNIIVSNLHLVFLFD